jgi:hypothetical protein
MCFCVGFAGIGSVGEMHVGVGDPGAILVGGVVVMVISSFEDGNTDLVGSGVDGLESGGVLRKSILVSF